ncbi:peptide deformylase [Clostridia bacterium]|nr:peptide deformylase [Clostridia bacterium]
MAIRTVFKLGDPMLRQTSRPVEAFDARLAQLMDDLADTMRKEGGIGLAAAQVGILRRAAVVENEGKFYELINPVVVNTSGECADSEGCLSVPDRRERITRPELVTVRAYNRKGEASEITVRGYTARAFLHEIDHMDGVLFIDRATERAGKRRNK